MNASGTQKACPGLRTWTDDSLQRSHTDAGRMQIEASLQGLNNFHTSNIAMQVSQRSSASTLHVKMASSHHLKSGKPILPTWLSDAHHDLGGSDWTELTPWMHSLHELDQLMSDGLQYLTQS